MHLLLCLAAGALGGMLWALIPAVARVYFGASEMVLTLMTNYVAIYLTDYLVKISLFWQEVPMELRWSLRK